MFNLSSIIEQSVFHFETKPFILYKPTTRTKSITRPEANSMAGFFLKDMSPCNQYKFVLQKTQSANEQVQPVTSKLLMAAGTNRGKCYIFCFLSITVFVNQFPLNMQLIQFLIEALLTTLNH